MFRKDASLFLLFYIRICEKYSILIALFCFENIRKSLILW